MNGFAIEFLRKLSAKTGLSLEYLRLSPGEGAAALASGRIDLLPHVPSFATADGGALLTRPILQERLFLFVPQASQIENWSEVAWSGKRIGVLHEAAELTPLTGPLAAAERVILDSPHSPAKAVAAGNVDAILADPRDIVAISGGAALRALPNSVLERGRSIALRRGLERERAALDAEIEFFVLTDEYRDLASRWLSPASDRFSLASNVPVSLVLGGGAVAVLGCAGTLFWMRWAQRQREAEAGARHALLEDVFNRMPFAMTVTRNDGSLMAHNDALTRMLPCLAPHIDRTDGFSTIVAEGVRGADPKLDPAALTQVASGIAAGNIGLTPHVVALGDGHHVEVVSRRLEDGSLMTLRRDVTAEIVSEAHARRLNNRLQTVMNAAQSAIIGVDASGTIITANLAACDMLGLEHGKLPCAWPERFALVDGGETRESMTRVLSPETLATGVMDGVALTLHDSLTNKTRRLRISTAELAVPDALRAVLVMDDITQQEQHRQMAERSSRLDALGQLTGGIAHDFNNLLAAILYSLEMAEAEDVPENVRTVLNLAKKSIGRGSAMTERLLAFAKAQPGRATSRAVAEVLEDAELLCRSAVTAGITLEFDRQAPNEMVHCDQGQLETALLNLVINARDAIAENELGGRIEVRAARAPDTGFLRITVCDTGPGMSEEVRQRAFDPFFTTKDPSTGTGLGLSMVYGFVEQSGGRITIEDGPDGGTAVVMDLPSADAKTGKGKTPKPQVTDQRGRGEHILIVDDERILLDGLSAVLRNFGYQTSTASSAEEALGVLAEATNVDLVLTDVLMPGEMNGRDLGRALQMRRPDLPVLYMSGFDGDISLNSSNEDVIRKPCPPADLARHLRAALSNRELAATG